MKKQLFFIAIAFCSPLFSMQMGNNKQIIPYTPESTRENSSSGASNNQNCEPCTKCLYDCRECMSHPCADEYADARRLTYASLCAAGCVYLSIWAPIT